MGKIRPCRSTPSLLMGGHGKSRNQFLDPNTFGKSCTFNLLLGCAGVPWQVLFTCSDFCSFLKFKAGDKSLDSVVSHEIAHSWTGNLVTTKNFEHFWVNEGFTTFLQRKMAGIRFGEPMRHFQMIGGWKNMEYTVNYNAKKFELCSNV